MPLLKVLYFAHGLVGFLDVFKTPLANEIAVWISCIWYSISVWNVLKSRSTMILGIHTGTKLHRVDSWAHVLSSAILKLVELICCERSLRSLNWWPYFHLITDALALLQVLDRLPNLLSFSTCICKDLVSLCVRWHYWFSLKLYINSRNFTLTICRIIIIQNSHTLQAFWHWKDVELLLTFFILDYFWVVAHVFGCGEAQLLTI